MFIEKIVIFLEVTPDWLKFCLQINNKHGSKSTARVCVENTYGGHVQNYVFANDIIGCKS